MKSGGLYPFSLSLAPADCMQAVPGTCAQLSAMWVTVGHE